jgi:trk system potassium uptake protein TrkH
MHGDKLWDVAVVVFLYVMTFLVGTLIFMLHGVPLAEASFEFATALSTVGLSVGITGPDMPTTLKITQMVGMWLGRLEFVAVFVALGRLGRWR